MLTCQQLTELVTEYAEGRLSFGRRLSIHVHLGLCRHCRAYLRQLRVTTKALGAMPSEPMPAAMKQELLARLRGLNVPPDDSV